jgi:hypothetical protein
MACRDCKWWDLTTLRSIQGTVFADCSFDVDSIESRIPSSYRLEVLNQPVPPLYGEGCPQFNAREERTDGE